MELENEREREIDREQEIKRHNDQTRVKLREWERKHNHSSLHPPYKKTMGRILKEYRK